MPVISDVNPLTLGLATDRSSRLSCAARCLIEQLRNIAAEWFSNRTIIVIRKLGKTTWGTLTLDDPKAFAGVVTFDAGANFLVLAGLAATGYSMKGEILSLFNGNRLVDTLRIADPAAAIYGQLAPGTPPLSFQHNSQGVVIANGGEASSQPGGIGTPLVTHA